MRWYPKNVGVWKKRFLFIPKVCRDCACKFCFELGWKVKSDEDPYKLIQLGDKNRSNRFPVSYEWYCNSCRKQRRDKKIQKLATRFRAGPDFAENLVGQLLGFNPTPVIQTKKPRKLKVK